MSKIKKPTKKIIPNQVFIGCRWTPERVKYTKILEKLKVSSPISFIIIGQDRAEQEAVELLALIKEKLSTSSFAIFDATGGNANVSLEYGYAEGGNIPCAIYLSEHENSKKKSNAGIIISDLAGKKRNVYKNKTGLERLLRTFVENHSYSKEFNACLKKGLRNKKKKGEKKRYRALCLKIVHFIDEKEEVRRSDLVQAVLEGYKESQINEMLSLLHKNNLIIVSTGRFSTVSISSYS